MSLGLYLIPIDVLGDYPYGHTLLECDRAAVVRDRLEGAPEYPVPHNFSCYYSHEDQESNDLVHYGVIDGTDDYGDPIVCYNVASIKKALNRAAASPKNRAVRDYIKHLTSPDDRIVAIWT